MKEKLNYIEEHLRECREFDLLETFIRWRAQHKIYSRFYLENSYLAPLVTSAVREALSNAEGLEVTTEPMPSSKEEAE